MTSTPVGSLFAGRRRRWLLVPALALPVWCGCGTQEYDERMQKTITSLKLQGRFVDLLPAPTRILGPDEGAAVSVSIRIPKAFAGVQPKDEQSQDPNFIDDTIPHDRVQPPFLDIPGFRFTYEQLVTSHSGQRVMSLYFGVVPADPEILDKIPGDLKAKLQLPNDVFWKNEQVVRPDGSSAAWKSITVQAPQGFYWTNYGRSNPETLDGTFGLWVHEDKGHYVFMAYRFPTSSAGLAPIAGGLPEALANAAGTLTVAPAAQAAAPAGGSQ